VNGPGEAREADVGIAAGRRRGHLFVKGKVVKVVPEDEMVDALVEWSQLVVAEGIEAAQQRADADAAAEAERDRLALLDEQGDDVNRAGEHITEIRRLDRDS
jgi:(E)-4-hydroxy-3-methylbut-2-enyl-diphosphate synthase